MHENEKWKWSHSVLSDSSWPPGLQPTRLPHPWDFQDKNTGVGCHFLLQCMEVKSESEAPQSCLIPRDPMDCSLPGSSVHGIFQARVLKGVAISFTKGSSWPRNQTRVSCIADRFFTDWANVKRCLKLYREKYIQIFVSNMLIDMGAGWVKPKN